MAGHVLQLKSDRLAHTAMYWMIEDSKRKRGRSKKTWRSTFKEDLEEMGVSWHGSLRFASDRERWRLLVARCSTCSAGPLVQLQRSNVCELNVGMRVRAANRLTQWFLFSGC